MIIDYLSGRKTNKFIQNSSKFARIIRVHMDQIIGPYGPSSNSHVLREFWSNTQIVITSSLANLDTDIIITESNV